MVRSHTLYALLDCILVCAVAFRTQLFSLRDSRRSKVSIDTGMKHCEPRSAAAVLFCRYTGLVICLHAKVVGVYVRFCDNMHIGLINMCHGRANDSRRAVS